MHKESEKSWLAHLAEDQRYAAMAGLGFSSGLLFCSSIRRNRRGCRRRRAHVRPRRSTSSMKRTLSFFLGS